MDYFITFLEGIITFISPCLLPILPVYISYFAGQNSGNQKRKALKNALGFVLGFTVVFLLLGLFAGTAGRFLQEHRTAVNLVSGLLVILFGLNFMEVIRIPFFHRNFQLTLKKVELGFFHSLLFGMVFSIGWTPCVGTFLGSALMLAAVAGSSLKGLLLLLCYSLGLGLPFVISAVLIESLKSTFEAIKRNYRLINRIAGGLLILVGILIMTGRFGLFLGAIS